jgi:hypothetical protein
MTMDWIVWAKMNSVDFSWSLFTENRSWNKDPEYYKLPGLALNITPRD